MPKFTVQLDLNLPPSWYLEDLQTKMAAINKELFALYPAMDSPRSGTQEIVRVTVDAADEEAALTLADRAVLSAFDVDRRSLGFIEIVEVDGVARD